LTLLNSYLLMLQFAQFRMNVNEIARVVKADTTVRLYTLTVFMTVMPCAKMMIRAASVSVIVPC
jgi:hypothetical protein